MAAAAAIPLFFCLFVLCLEKRKATYGILECKVTYAGKNRKATYRIGKPEVTYTFQKVGDRDCDTEKTAHTWWFTRCALFKKT